MRAQPHTHTHFVPNSHMQVANAAPFVRCRCTTLVGGGASIQLYLEDTLPHPGALQQLLAALLPDGDKPLVELELHGSEMCPWEEPRWDAVAVLRGCTLLRTLRRLDLSTGSFGHNGSDDAAAALAALLEQAPAVSELTVSGLYRLPECVVGRRGLRKLNLESCFSLRELPPGPYLKGRRAGGQGLQVQLQVTHCSLVRPPSSPRVCCAHCMLLRRCVLRRASGATCIQV